MGYSTYFKGKFKFDTVLTLEQYNDLKDLHNSFGIGDRPNSYCQWTPSKCGNYLEHSGGEKFYMYVDWLLWIIVNRLKPWGRFLNGSVQWQGEEVGDVGIINVKHNNVWVKEFGQIQDYVDILEAIPKMRTFGDVCYLISQFKEGKDWRGLLTDV